MLKIKMYRLLLVWIAMKAGISSGVEMDKINCGIDDDPDVLVGKVPIETYPWLGLLYYSSFTPNGDDVRAVVTVALIQEEFVIGAAAEIGPIPKTDFRRNSRVLLGQDWNGQERNIRSYVIHPEYDETHNTVALVQLREPVRYTPMVARIYPLCPPPDILRDPEFYVVKFKDDFEKLQKEVIPVEYVPSGLCRDFYVSANLYAKKMRPPHVACAVADDEKICVWEAGAALVSRDVWGRWQLLGLGVRGPGCGAPSRYLDMMSYYPWIEASLYRFRQITISKLHDHKYVIRATGRQGAPEVGLVSMRYGACDPEEKINLVYREMIVMRTDNDQYQFMTYNLTLVENVEYSCLTLELVNATAVTEFRIHHTCLRDVRGPPCYRYRGSKFDISVYMMFSDKCRFEMFAWGFKKNMTLIDIQDWKWEEGTYYEDFSMTRVEYRGDAEQTLFGFEAIEEKMWVPEYDYWTTTEFDNTTTTTQGPPEERDPNEAAEGYGGYRWSKYMYKTLNFSDDPGYDSEFLLGIRW